MAGATNVLIRENFGKWFRTRGFLMVLAVALIPPALTASWVGTHDADIAVTDLAFAPAQLVAGDNVTITATVQNVHNKAVGAFDVTIRVGFYQGAEGTWQDVHNETLRVDGLAEDETHSVSTTWTTQGGAYLVEAYADFFQEDIAEVEELNNFRPTQIQVAYAPVQPNLPPPPPADTNNSTLPDAQLRLETIQQDPIQLYEDDDVAFTVTVANDGPEDASNASVTVQIHRINAATGTSAGIEFDQTTTVAVGAGATEDVTFDVSQMPRGLFAVAAFLDTSGAARGDDESDNVLIQQLEVQRRLVFQEPPEKATAKEFYREQILLPLQYTLLIPLIGLFFAGGALHDERSRGNLIYLLTRPVPRWSLPLTRFVTGFLVALVAVLIGIFVTYVVLLGTPQAEPAYLWWPLVFGVLVLLVYSAVFTFVGVVTDRPYLVGLLYVLGFETLVLAGRRILVNEQPLVQDWVLNFSILAWIEKAFTGWDPSGGFSLLPEGDEAVRAIFVLLGITVVALLAAMYAVRVRQFPE